MNFFNYKNYSSLGWLGALVWLLPIIFVNIPFQPPWHLSTGGQYHCGYPFVYVAFIQQPNGTIASSFSFPMAIANVTLIMLNAFAVLYLLNHYFRQFSLLTIFLVVTFSAFAILAVQFAHSGLSDKKFEAMLGIVYFLPIVVVMLFIVYRSIDKLRKRFVDNRSRNKVEGIV